MSILQLQLTKGLVQKRPSATCKTPYVADVLYNDETIMVHTPALGCCGLCDKDSEILMSKVESKKNVCNYRADLALFYEPKLERNILIGTNPKLAEQLIDNCLKQNNLWFLKDYQEYKRERKIENTNSRFDFAGVDKEGKPFVLEIKNVPLADYVDCTEKDKKKMDMSIFDEKKYNEKIAYFPDGYRKTSKGPISPRAIKHLQDLMFLKKEGIYRPIICYVIQREDAGYFQPSVIDETYREVFYEAQLRGVEIYAIQFKWNEEGEAHILNENVTIL